MTTTTTTQEHHDLAVGDTVTIGAGKTTWRVTYATWSSVSVRSAAGRTRFFYIDAPREADRVSRLTKVAGR